MNDTCPGNDESVVAAADVRMPRGSGDRHLGSPDELALAPQTKEGDWTFARSDQDPYPVPARKTHRRRTPELVASWNNRTKRSTSGSLRSRSCWMMPSLTASKPSSKGTFAMSELSSEMISASLAHECGSSNSTIM